MQGLTRSAAIGLTFLKVLAHPKSAKNIKKQATSPALTALARNTTSCHTSPRRSCERYNDTVAGSRRNPPSAHTSHAARPMSAVVDNEVKWKTHLGRSQIGSEAVTEPLIKTAAMVRHRGLGMPWECDLTRRRKRKWIGNCRGREWSLLSLCRERKVLCFVQI